MKEGIGWGLFIVSLVIIGFMYFGKKPININIPTNDDAPSEDDEVKCELRDTYGRTVTITGKANDPQFVSLCQRQQNQQVYVYGYPYYFVRWRRRHGDWSNGNDGDAGNGGEGETT